MDYEFIQRTKNAFMFSNKGLSSGRLVYTLFHQILIGRTRAADPFIKGRGSSYSIIFRDESDKCRLIQDIF